MKHFSSSPSVISPPRLPERPGPPSSRAAVQGAGIRDPGPGARNGRCFRPGTGLSQAASL